MHQPVMMLEQARGEAVLAPLWLVFKPFCYHTVLQQSVCFPTICNEAFNPR